MPYKIYTQQNLADTCRDPDDYVYDTLGYRNDLNEAILVAENFIKTRFFHKDTKLRAREPNEEAEVYHATDFCSYGKTIIIKEVADTAWVKLHAK